MRLDSPRADRLTALVLLALGLAMLAGGYTMDRLEIRQIHPASIPGLVPMILGATLALCAVLLYLGADADPARETPNGVSWRNLGVAALLSLVYALVLIGHLPFFWATALYITAFAGVFGWPETPDPRARIRGLVAAVALGPIAAAAISVLFRDGFLVRLP